MPGPDIFLSYNREDQTVAQLFAEGFEAARLSVWWDVTLRSGEAYDAVTEEALKTAKAVVVLWSPRSVVSRWVRAEASIADENGTLVPATIEACDLPVMFRLTQTADLTGWKGKSDDRAWLAFLSDVRGMTGSGAKQAAQEHAGASVATDAPAGGPPFVALLPLACRAGDEELELLAEDLTEEIARELGRNSIFHVIATATLAKWSGQAAERSLRDEFGVAYLIEGKLQRTGTDVRLTLQLIDTATGGMLKSMRHVRRQDEIDADPEEFQIVVAAGIGEEIEQIEMNRAMARSGPLTGWDHLLRALAYARRSGSDGIRRGTEEARSAVAKLPDLGLAHATLANVLAVPPGAVGTTPDEDLIEEIRTHVRRAMQLDGDNPAVLGQLMTSYAATGDSEAGFRAARRTVELDPNSPDALFWLATSQTGLGQTFEAITTLDRYDRLSRQNRFRHIAYWIRGMCQFLDGQPQEAAAALDQALAIHPEFTNALKWKAIVAEHRGDAIVAQAAIMRLREIEPDVPLEQHVWQMVRIPKLGARCAEAVRIFRRLWEESGGGA